MIPIYILFGRELQRPDAPGLYYALPFEHDVEIVKSQIRAILASSLEEHLPPAGLVRGGLNLGLHYQYQPYSMVERGSIYELGINPTYKDISSGRTFIWGQKFIGNDLLGRYIVDNAMHRVSEEFTQFQKQFEHAAD